jgi:hypothetical protein
MWTRALAAVALAALLAGCATPSDPGAMAVRDVRATAPVSESISINVTGGRATDPMMMSQISNADFREALKQSFLSAGLTGAVPDKDGRYRLDAYIGALDQPFIGGDFTVKMEVAYTLTDVAANKVVWQKSISSSYTARISDTALGVERLRLANEGAARRNIEAVVQELSKLAPR